MSYATVQTVVDALTGGEEVNPALTELLTCIISGQQEGFTEAGVIDVKPPGLLILELLDGTRWAVGAFRLSP